MAALLRVSSLIVLFALLVQGSAAGQQSEALSPGMRVRVQVATLPSVKGTVVSVDSTAFGFRPEDGGDTITIAYSRVQRLDVSQGLHHRVLRDAVMGGIGGMVVGGIIGATSHANFPSPVVVIPPEDPGDGGGGCTIRDSGCVEPPDPVPGQPVVVHREQTGADALRTARSAGIGAIAGVLAGAMVGRLMKSEVWKRTPSERFQLQVAAMPPQRRGLVVRLSFAL